MWTIGSWVNCQVVGSSPASSTTTLKQSDSYIAFKTRTQEIFNFAVLVTNSVPSLKQNISLIKSGKIKRIPEPDYFQPSTDFEITETTLTDLKTEGLESEKIKSLRTIINTPLNDSKFKNTVIDLIGKDLFSKHRTTIKRQSSLYIDNLNSCTADYQKKLASYLFFSLFSYFESFIGDISNEVLENLEHINVSKYLKDTEAIDTAKEEKILDTKFDPRKKDRYSKFSKELIQKGYKEPEQLIFSSMISMLKSSIESLKANDIPEFLKKSFYFELNKSDNTTYHNLRDNRNSLGHGGTSFSPNLKDVIEANKFFKRISKEIDSQISKNYLGLNNFQKEK